MPIYEFACSACGREFEIVRSRRGFDPKSVKCKQCGSPNVERRFGRLNSISKKKD